MSKFIQLLISIALLVFVSNALPQRYRHELIYDDGSRMNLLSNDNKEIKTPTLTVIQAVDHFNRYDNRTFTQRYFVNTDYFPTDVNNQKNTPVFLCVGGEGPPLDASVLISSVHCNDMIELAQQIQGGALLFALEHRYYGPSMPTEDYSTENMQYLNTEQALEDLAEFHAQMTKMYNLSSNNKWVTWGGSYPGMVAALARLRYPHLIHASVSSSSPLNAAVDMTGYNDVVANSMTLASVGGSEQCLNVIKSGHEAIGELLNTEDGRRSLEKQFNICVAGSLENVNNREAFAGDGVIYLPVQSNDPSCKTPLCDIASVCSTLLNDSTEKPIDSLARVAAEQHAGTCTSVNFNAFLVAMAVPSNPGRSWFYQTCTEWGFYQTCETNTNCPYTRGLHTLDADFAMCQAAFGISAENVQKQIDATTERYGGQNIQGTRIMFPSGEVDPWSANSVLVSPKNSVEEPTLFVLGASHHFWTHPSLPTDSAEVVQARKTIWAQVTEWLSEN